MSQAGTLITSAGGGGTTQFNTDSGNATPIAGIIQIVGGEGIDTSGATNIVTIACELATAAANVGASNIGACSFYDDDFGVSSGFTSLVDTVVKVVSSGSGTLTPSGHHFSILGGTGITSTHAGTVITIAGVSGSETVVGMVEFATDAETTTGTSQALAVHPHGLNARLGAQTVYGVMLGGGGAGTNLTATAAGGTGVILTGVGGANPTWTTATYPSTTAQGDILLSATANVISALTKDANATRYLSNTGVNNNAAWAQVDVSNGVTGVMTVPNGGTGASTLTGVLTGNGVAAITANAVTQYGTVIAGASNAVSSIAPHATAGIPYISQGAAANPTFGTAVVAGGGTGLTSITSHGILTGNGTSALSVTAEPSNGQLLIGSTGNAPVLAALASADSSVTITNGAGTIDLSVTGGGLFWSVETGTTHAAVVNEGVICNNAGTRVVVTLPTTAAVGSILRVAGMGAAGWGIAQNSSESIIFGILTTTVGVGGKIESSDENDCIELVCIVADTTWLVLSSLGNLSIT